MARRNEVLTLFGATPEQIMEKQRREQAAMVLGQQDPFARAGSAIGIGLARMFGGESADVIESRRLQETKKGLNLNTSEGMREAASRLSAAGFEDRALELLNMADQRDTAEQARTLGATKIIDKQIPVTTTYFDEGSGTTKSVTVKIDVPHKFNVLTDELTPIFDNDYLQSLAQEKVQVDLESKGDSSPESRVGSNMRQDLINLPIGGVYELPSGRFVRKNPDGSFTDPMTRDQINKESGIDEQARVNDAGA